MIVENFFREMWKEKTDDCGNFKLRQKALMSYFSKR